MPGINKQSIVNLAIDGDTKIFRTTTVRRLEIYESVLMLAPLLNLDIYDQYNALREALPLRGSEVLSVEFGTDQDNLNKMEFYIIQAYPQANSNPADGTVFSIRGILKNSLPFYTPTQNRAYRNQRISEVVTNIVKTDFKGIISSADTNKTGVSAIIEDTREKPSTWIQPFWTDGQFFRYLARRAQSQTYSNSGYMYYMDRNSRIHFKSASMAMAAATKMTYKLVDAVGKEYDDNTIVNYEAINEGCKNSLDGAGGRTGGYFDMDAGEYKFIDATPQSVKLKSPTGNILLTSDFINANNRYMGHLGSFFIDDFPETTISTFVEDHLVKQLHSLIKLPMIVKGYGARDGLVPGDMVNISIPSANPEYLIDDTYSGPWMIEGITHVPMNTYFMKVTLTRAGIGYKDDKKLVKV